TPLPCSEKKEKKKSQTVAQPKPKSQDPEASEALPQNRKKIQDSNDLPCSNQYQTTQ
ncbi:hypothetical protein Tco_1323352, partial [Tanacetum coccineum]